MKEMSKEHESPVGEAEKRHLSKPVVMQVLPSLISGGVERVTLDMAEFLAQWDEKPTYVVSQGGGLVDELEKRGAIHIHLPLASKNPFKIIWNGLRLAKLAKALGVELFHVRSRAPAWSTFLASKVSGVPYVATYHGAYRNKGYLSNWYNSGMVRGRCVITISDFITRLVMKDHVSRNPKIVKISPGIDLTRFDPHRFTQEDYAAQRQEWGIPEDAFVMLFIGRIAPAKRFDLGIKALAALKNQNVYLAMAGSVQGREKLGEELLGLARALGVSDRVRLIKDFPNIPLAYGLSDLVLFPTEHIETFGRISAEGGAMGKIVIGADIGAVTELIQHEKTGFIIPTNDLKTLVKTIEKVLSMTPEAKKAMEDQAYSHIRSLFPSQRMVGETLDLYHRLLKNQDL